MSTKKSKANGASHAPVPPVLADDTVTAPVKKSDGKSNGSKTPNGNGSSYGPTEIDGFIDARELLKVLMEVRNGNFSARMPSDSIGLSGKIYDALNDIILLNELLVQELTEARKIIGKQGKLNHRVELPRVARGSWNTAVESINSLISDLVHPTIEIAHVISSVAKGNL